MVCFVGYLERGWALCGTANGAGFRQEQHSPLLARKRREIEAAKSNEGSLTDIPFPSGVAPDQNEPLDKGPQGSLYDAGLKGSQCLTAISPKLGCNGNFPASGARIRPLLPGYRIPIFASPNEFSV